MKTILKNFDKPDLVIPRLMCKGFDRYKSSQQYGSLFIDLYIFLLNPVVFIN